MIPAGLLNTNVELFAVGDRLMSTYNGVVIPFAQLPTSILQKFLNEMNRNPEAVDCLKKMGYTSEVKMLERFCWCRFGAFDATPDMVSKDAEFANEYWDCGCRNSCPFEFTLCDRVKCGDKYLTKKEIMLVKLIATGIPDKQICYEANITYLTVTTHKKNIYKKLDVHSQAEITAFAYKNNLIS